MGRTDYIGRRVARWRDIAGITQRELADRAAVYAAVPALRGALDDDPLDDHPIDQGRLGERVAAASAARAACDYPTLAKLLPPVIADTRRLANIGGDGADLGQELFVRAAVCGAIALKPFGFIDLATRMCERA